MNGHVIVVGGSSGIGAATGRALRDRGARVSGLARRACPPDVADASFPCDVADGEALDGAIDRATEALGPPVALVYSAGSGTFGHTLAIPEKLARASFDINLWGLDRAVRRVVPGMRQRRVGVVVAVLSIAALRAVPFESYYAAAKAAAARYLDCLAYELEPDGVAVRYLCPGFIDTGFLEKSAWFGVDPPGVRGSGTTTEDVAHAVVEAIERGARTRVLGWRERAITLADRLAPGLYDALLRRRHRPR